MDAKDKIYYLRLGLGVFGGALSGIAKFMLDTAGDAIFLIVILYIISIYVIIYLFKIKPTENGEITMKDIVLNGLGTYIMTWFIIWIIILNLLLKL